MNDGVFRGGKMLCVVGTPTFDLVKGEIDIDDDMEVIRDEAIYYTNPLKNVIERPFY